MTTWRGAGRTRALGLAVGCLAGVAMIVVGCTSVTQGSGQGNASDAPAYRTSVSQSVEASSSSSVARESKQQEAEATEAVLTSCNALVDGSNASVTAVNAFIGATNEDAPEAADLVGPAVESLNDGADQVTGSLADALPEDVASALNGWAEAARGLASVLPTASGPDELNAAIGKLQSAKDAAVSACQAAA